MGKGITELGATALSSGIGALGGIVGSVAGGLFNANQAKINRKFQERMYNKQVEDNINFWKMQQDYNLPSAQLQRLRDAGLSGLLMYGEGGLTGNIAGQAPAAGTAPHGAQAQASFHTPLDFANLALVRAQARALEASADKQEQEVEESKARQAATEYDTFYRKLTQKLEMSIKAGHSFLLEKQAADLSDQILWRGVGARENMFTLAQARVYEIKRFNLDESYRGGLLQQGWSNIANDTQRVKQGWRQLAIDMRRLTNETNMTNAQIGALQWSVLSDKAMFGYRFEGLSLENQLKKWDTHLKKVGLDEKKVQVWNGVLKNYYLQNIGQETMSSFDLPRGLWQSSHTPVLKGNYMPQDMLVLPTFKFK